VLILTTVLNIGLTVLWLPRWGVPGATLATALCAMIGPVIMMGIYYKVKIKIPVVWLYRHVLRGILVYLMLGCAAALGLGQLISNSLLSFFVCGVVFVAVSLGGYFTFGMTGEEKTAVWSFLHKKLGK
jgi:O-antigen/teichoic acid export membrane protein